MIGAPPDRYQHLLSLVGAFGRADDWYALGCLLHDMKRHGAAAGCFARVLQQQPDNYRARNNYGWNLHQSGRTEVARSPLLYAGVEADQTDGMPFALLSQVDGTLGLTEGAVLTARESVKRDPQPAVNHLALAFALANAGEWQEAWREYEH